MTASVVWSGTAPSADDVTAAGLLVMEFGPQYPSPIRREFIDPSTRACASSACGSVAALFQCFTPSTHERSAMLPIGGEKTCNNCFYERMVTVADDKYDTYIEEMDWSHDWT